MEGCSRNRRMQEDSRDRRDNRMEEDSRDRRDVRVEEDSRDRRDVRVEEDSRDHRRMESSRDSPPRVSRVVSTDNAPEYISDVCAVVRTEKGRSSSSSSNITIRDVDLRDVRFGQTSKAAQFEGTRVIAVYTDLVTDVTAGCSYLFKRLSKSDKGTFYVVEGESGSKAVKWASFIMERESSNSQKSVCTASPSPT
jgi:hypothetical protein